jgi:hypothetical protein
VRKERRSQLVHIAWGVGARTTRQHISPCPTAPNNMSTATRLVKRSIRDSPQLIEHVRKIPPSNTQF